MLRAESAELLWKTTDEALISFLFLHNPRFLFFQDRKVQFRVCRFVSDPKASAQKTLSTTPPYLFYLTVLFFSLGQSEIDCQYLPIKTLETEEEREKIKGT